MNKLLVIVNDLNPPQKKLTHYLKASLSKGNSLFKAKVEDLIFVVDGKNIEISIPPLNKDIKEFDLVYFKYAKNAGNLALCLNYLGIKYFDKTVSNVGVGNKFSSYLKLSMAGLPTIPAICTYPKNIKDYKSEIIAKLGFPMVGKNMVLQKGEGVFLIKNEEELLKLANAKNKPIIFQKFIKSTEEYRILVLKDTIGAFEKKIRTDKNEFRSNVALGAKEEFLDINQIPGDLKEMSFKAAETLDIQIAGVDVMKETAGKLWLLEANRGPGMTYDSDNSPELSNSTKFIEREMTND